MAYPITINWRTPVSELVQAFDRDIFSIPAWLDFKGNMVVQPVVPTLMMGGVDDNFELPVADIGKITLSDRLCGYITDTKFFGRFLLEFPLKYTEAQPRTDKEYSILWHDQEFKEFIFKARNPERNASYPNDFRFARSYRPGYPWWHLLKVGPNRKVYSHLLSHIKLEAINDFSPMEMPRVIQELPYKPGPFHCVGCKKGWFTEGYDVVLVKEESRETPQYITSNTPPYSPIGRVTRILFLTQFCPSCFPAFRMLGLLEPLEEKI